MGIPSFFRWLSERFPLCIADFHSDDTLHFDNLYLDMNGLIHPCFHPEGLPPPTSYDEVFKSIFQYIDILVSIVRPKKLLFLAIDGVAPRAKMNQQRSRRFRSAKEAGDEYYERHRGRKEAAKKNGLGNELEDNEKSVSFDDESSDNLDSNVITPGTKFMALLSTALSYYIHLRLNRDPGWEGMKVILSDSSVPGEGEHKIMSFIRLQRNLPGYDLNTRHCMYGLDADLIMLALATHEIHFSILRENVRNAPRPSKPFKYENRFAQARKRVVDVLAQQEFQFLHVWILREYLQHTMKIPDPTEKIDFERVIDDFVFMCLFVGNDFLPHMPSLDISKGAIDLLIEIYKKEFVRMGGYLTDSCQVNLARVQHFLCKVADHEPEILKRLQMKLASKKHMKRVNYHTKRSVVKGPSGEDSVKSLSTANQAPNSIASISTNTEVDKIKFSDCWKERYYAEKFQVENEEDRERTRSDLVLKYTEGMCWVMHYYYGGVCSWQWFYPYHYAPFASDFRGIENLEIQFTLGEPFKPFDQLMAVLPTASGRALPLSYRMLMTDPSSPLLPFYPEDFELDMDGKRHAWQAICKLPFIEESLLLSEVAKVEHTLTDEERQRNSLGLDILFVYISHPLAKEMISFYERNVGNPELAKSKIEQLISPKLSTEMNGYMVISDKHVQPLEIDSPFDGWEKIEDNQVLSVFYKFPPFHAHIPRIRKGVCLPPTTVNLIKPSPYLLNESSAVVGRLHSVRPVPNSISGKLLSKPAHRLVLAWYFAKLKEKKQSLECNVASEPGSTLSSGRKKSKKRKKGQKKKQNSGSENSDAQMAANGMVAVSSTEIVEPTSISKFEVTLSATCNGDNQPKESNIISELCDNQPKEPNIISELCDSIAVVRGVNEPISVPVGGVNEPTSVPVVGNKQYQTEKQNTDVEIRDTEMGTASNPLPSGDSTTGKRKRKQKSKKIESEVREPAFVLKPGVEPSDDLIALTSQSPVDQTSYKNDDIDCESQNRLKRQRLLNDDSSANPEKCSLAGESKCEQTAVVESNDAKGQPFVLVRPMEMVL